MTTLDLTLTPIDNPAARERMERAGDVSASLVESLTSDEIRTLCGNVERDAERGADSHAVPTALLFRLLRTALTGPAEVPLAAPTTIGYGEVARSIRARVLDLLRRGVLSIDDLEAALLPTVPAAYRDRTRDEIVTAICDLRASGQIVRLDVEPVRFAAADDTLRRETEHARSLVRGPVGGGW